MSVDELFEDIFKKRGLDSPTFLYWLKSSKPFSIFVEKYNAKIQGKISNAQKDPKPEEKLKDVLFEIEVAYLMLKTGRFSVEYEHYGDKGPDFTVTDKTGETFNVEVKRIREEDSLQTRFDIWQRYVRKKIDTIPSILALYMKIDNVGTSLDLVDRLESKTAEIISFITDIIVTAERKIIIEGEKQYSVSVPEFEDEFILRFRKPPYPTDTLSNDGGESPIFSTGEEYRKFDELYWKVFKNQVITDMINVLAINTNSETHDSWALRICMYYLDQLAQRNDIQKTRRLSGVLFRGAWFTHDGERNILWCDEEAFRPIPKDIREALRRMN